MTRNDPIRLIREKILLQPADRHHQPPEAGRRFHLHEPGPGRHDRGAGQTGPHRQPRPHPFPFSRSCRRSGRITIGQIPPRGFDLVILLECANVDALRAGDTWTATSRSTSTITIPTMTTPTSTGSTRRRRPSGRWPSLLAERMKLPLTPEIAAHLYCAIVSDTGCFQFSNTSARAFEVCHKLVRAGANPIKTTRVPVTTPTRPRKSSSSGRSCRPSG